VKEVQYNLGVSDALFPTAPALRPPRSSDLSSWARRCPPIPLPRQSPVPKVFHTTCGNLPQTLIPHADVNLLSTSTMPCDSRADNPFAVETTGSACTRARR
jgi:hypothetical protein